MTENKYTNVSATATIKTGYGKLMGMYVNSTSTGTIEFNDGLTATEAGIKATGVLTSSGACVPAVYAQSVLTSDATNNTEDETVTIGSTVYRWRDTLAQAYDVKIGASAAASLDNLKAAINASGTPGTEYFAGTLAHPDVIATTNTNTTQLVVARVIGTDANTIATTEAGAHTSWADTTLGGGTGVSVTGVATTAATITIDTETYTAVTSLAETHGLTDVPYQVLWVTNEATFLDNLKSAINNAGTEGTDYGTGTPAHSSVEATTNTSTAQTIQALAVGTAGNTIATTETLANYAWAATKMSGGFDPSILINNTITPAIGYHDLGGVAFTNGLLATIANTLDVTIYWQ